MSSMTSIGATQREQRLVAAAKGGDAGAYAQLVRRNQVVAFRAAYLVTGSVAEAEDAAQEACVKAWLALPRFRSDSPFRPWLVQIAINEARNRRRAAGRRAGLALRLAASPAAAAEAPSAEFDVLAADERARLVAAIGRLREQDQLVIAARYFLGLSEAETAAALGVRPGTVKSRLSRALRRLRRRLTSDWEPGPEDEFRPRPEDEPRRDPGDEARRDPGGELRDEPEDELQDEPEDELQDEPEDELRDEPEGQRREEQQR